MKKLRLSLLALSLVAFVSCKNENKDTVKTDDILVVSDDIDHDLQDDTEMNTDMDQNLTVMMASKSGSTATGEVRFSEDNGKVSMEAKFTGLSPGTHAIHLHESSDCSAADGSSAGGHWNPTHEKHGKWGDAKGYHKGDIGNLEADADGNATLKMETDEWCISCTDENKNILGKSIIVHEGADDFVSQPTGDAGGRVSCGGIIK